MKYISVMLLIALSASAPAFAASGDDIRDATECRPAKDIIKFFSKFDKMKPEQRDTVDAVISAGFKTDDGVLPERLYYKHKDTEVPFTLMPDGNVPDFANITQQHKDGELCVDDPSRAGMNREEDGLEFSVDFDVKFKSTPGEHTLASLRDGTKDGKSFYKKIVPGPMKLMIPSMTHVSLTFDEDVTDPVVSASKNGAVMDGLKIEMLSGTYVIGLDDLEDIGADSLVISGGGYTLEPSPSAEKMKKIGFTEDGEDEK